MVKKGTKEVKGVKANGYKESENTLFLVNRVSDYKMRLCLL